MNMYEQYEINDFIHFRNYTVGGTVNLNKMLVAQNVSLVNTTLLQPALSNDRNVKPELTVNAE
jgi:hypothetical protein